MLVSPLLPEDCIQASLLHHQGFYKGWSPQEFENFLQNILVQGLKIKEGKELKGFILWQSVKDEAEILTLVVDKKYQNSGIGTALLKAMITRLKEQGVSTLFLEVAQDNEPAKKFYIKHDFCFVSTRPGYYLREKGQNVSALIFQKNTL